MYQQHPQKGSNVLLHYTGAMALTSGLLWHTQHKN